MKQALTEREREILTLIRRHQRIRIPTVRELARLAGVKSPATIHEHLTALRRKGHLERRKGVK